MYLKKKKYRKRYLSYGFIFPSSFFLVFWGFFFSVQTRFFLSLGNHNSRLAVYTPGVSIDTPSVSVNTPAISINTPGISIHTPGMINLAFLITY